MWSNQRKCKHNSYRLEINFQTERTCVCVCVRLGLSFAFSNYSTNNDAIHCTRLWLLCLYMLVSYAPIPYLIKLANCIARYTEEAGEKKVEGNEIISLRRWHILRSIQTCNSKEISEHRLNSCIGSNRCNSHQHPVHFAGYLIELWKRGTMFSIKAVTLNEFCHTISKYE